MRAPDLPRLPVLAGGMFAPVFKAVDIKWPACIRYIPLLLTIRIKNTVAGFTQLPEKDVMDGPGAVSY